MISASNTAPRLNRTICMHVCQAQYYIIIQHAIQFRMILGMLIKEHPELFPPEIACGYTMKEISQKGVKSALDSYLLRCYSIVHGSSYQNSLSQGLVSCHEPRPKSGEYLLKKIRLQDVCRTASRNLGGVEHSNCCILFDAHTLFMLSST